MRVNLYDLAGIKVSEVEVGWPAPRLLTWQNRSFYWSVFRRGYYEYVPSPIGESHMPVHECTFLYPTFADFIPASKTIAAKIRGEAVDLGCLVHCSWVVAGYAASHVDHDHEVMFQFQSEAALADKLEELASGNSAPAQAAAIPWKAIGLMILQLVEQWLAQR